MFCELLDVRRKSIVILSLSYDNHKIIGRYFVNRAPLSIDFVRCKLVPINSHRPTRQRRDKSFVRRYVRTVRRCELGIMNLYFVYYCLYLCSLPVYILVNKAVYINVDSMLPLWPSRLFLENEHRCQSGPVLVTLSERC